MRTVHLFIVAIMSLLVAAPVFATKKPSDKERKERANAEYARCIAIAKEKGVSAVLLYIREKQTGTSLKSSPEKLAQENCAADAMKLPRYQDIDEIEVAEGDELVELAVPGVKIKSDVPRSRHLACSWTCGYLAELAEYLEKASGGTVGSKQELLVASLVRSRADQDAISKVKVFYKKIKRKLKKYFRGGRSFADCSSSAVCSTHLTGATVDISLLGADKKKRELLYERLREDREKGRILAILEVAGNHFHVFVIPPQYVSNLETPAS